MSYEVVHANIVRATTNSKVIPAASKGELLRRAQEIYENYVDPRTAQYLVNIAATLRHQIRKALEGAGEKLSSFGATPVSSSSTLETISVTVSDLTDPSPHSQEMVNFLLPNGGPHVSPPDSPVNHSPPAADAAFETLAEAMKAVEKALFDLMNNDSYLRYRDSQYFMKLEAESKKSGSRLDVASYPLQSKSTNSVRPDSKVSKGSKGSKTDGQSKITESGTDFALERDLLLATPDIELTSSQSNRNQSVDKINV